MRLNPLDDDVMCGLFHVARHSLRVDPQRIGRLTVSSYILVIKTTRVQRNTIINHNNKPFRRTKVIRKSDFSIATVCRLAPALNQLPAGRGRNSRTEQRGTDCWLPFLTPFQDRKQEAQLWQWYRDRHATWEIPWPVKHLTVAITSLKFDVEFSNASEIQITLSEVSVPPRYHTLNCKSDLWDQGHLIFYRLNGSPEGNYRQNAALIFNTSSYDQLKKIWSNLSYEVKATGVWIILL
jgi:hypothetical protein